MRPRSSSLPTVSDAQLAFQSARRLPARRLVAYTVLATFIGAFLILTFGNGNSKAWEELEVGTLKETIPDFENIPGTGIRTITLEELNERQHKRFIVVGDIHGMYDTFERMLHMVHYDPDSDYLIHVGDLVAKGPDSSQVMSTMAFSNVTGVRGNHDQKVIEWRSWIEWVQSHKGGRAWLRDMESKTPGEIEEMRKKKKDTKTWKIPDGWVFGGEHYWLARNLKSNEEEYMNNLPLVLHFPMYHLFVVHAGVLPLNPTIPLSSKHQPLSHVPGSLRIKGQRNRHQIRGASAVEERGVDLAERDLEAREEWLEERDRATGSSHHRKPKNKHDLRTIQEKMLLTTIPQNTIPFNLLNMRSLERNKPTRGKKGRPWSEVWNDVLGRCQGFPDDAVEVALTEEGRPPVKGPDGKERELEWWESLVYSDGEVIDWDAEKDHKVHSWTKIPTRLPCHPTTVIYGHAAGRGLDIKRWSLGLDSGCVYGRRMTALIFSEKEVELESVDRLMERDSEGDVEHVQVGEELQHGGRLHGRLVSIKCPDVGA